MEDQPFHSITGTSEVDEPSTDIPASAAASSIPNIPSTSSIPTPKKLYSTQTTSATSSPRASRESSPVRPPLKSNASSRSNTGRPRKNSAHDVSPARSTSSTPNPPLSSAALQRGLSASNTPQLHPSVSDTPIKAPVPQKPAVSTEFKDIPRWPISPRLRSPPPVSRPASAPRKIEQEVPAISVQRSTPTAESQQENAEEEDTLAVPGGRAPARGISASSNVSTLETVQEISQPNTPALGIDGFGDNNEDGRKVSSEHDNVIDAAFAKPLKSKGSVGTNESESEGGGKGDIKMSSTSTAPAIGARPNVVPASSKSFGASATVVSRGKPPGEGSTKNMTVETETVSSIPQVALGGGAGGPGNNGSLRTKPSSETIRPKKEKKKTTRKVPSVAPGTGEPSDSSSSRRKLHHHRSVRDFHLSRPESAGPLSTIRHLSSTGPQRPRILRRSSLSLVTVSNMLTRQSITASSKADIFEAKIASAVDEANSSDSEETFVYESNPPEASDRPRRFHSRTPSATSMASQVDQRGNSRSIHGVMDSGHSVAMKKSMKFANSFNTNGSEAGNGEDDGKGTARSNAGTGRGTTHHHNIGRWGRNGGNGHPSLFDNESPFPNVAKAKLSGNGSRNSSRPTSPRVSQVKIGNGKKSMPSGYDIDDETGADDERIPLMGSTLRSNRTMRRRQPLSLRQLEHQARHQTSCLNRFAACLVLSVMIILVVAGAIGLMFATTQPLTEVEIRALKKVLASESEIMLDMEVMARNPNVVVIAVDSMDVKVFAKSKHISSDSEWWRRPQNSDRRKRPQRGTSSREGLHVRDDPWNDPPVDDDDPSETDTILLGHIYTFDSPLLFDGSPFKHIHSIATGSISLENPGNGTDADGIERWERALKYEFDLIVRGVLRYQLPMTQRVRSVAVDGVVTVKPNKIEGSSGDGSHP